MIGMSIVGALISPSPAQASKRHGVHKEYYDSGRLRLYLKFKQGLIVRKRAYYRNGRLKLDHVYKNGRAVLIKNFYESGRLFSIWTAKEGVTKYFHPDGRLRVEVSTPQKAQR